MIGSSHPTRECEVKEEDIRRTTITSDRSVPQVIVKSESLTALSISATEMVANVKSLITLKFRELSDEIFIHITHFGAYMQTLGLMIKGNGNRCIETLKTVQYCYAVVKSINPEKSTSSTDIKRTPLHRA